MDKILQNINWDIVAHSKGFVFSLEELKKLIDSIIDNSVDIFNNKTFTTPELIIDFEESIFLKHRLIIQLKKKMNNKFYIYLKIIYENGYADGGVLIKNNINTIQELKEKIDIVEIRKELKELYYFYFYEIDRSW